MRKHRSRLMLPEWTYKVFGGAAIVLISLLVCASSTMEQPTPEAAAADKFAAQPTADALKTLSREAQTTITAC